MMGKIYDLLYMNKNKASDLIEKMGEVYAQIIHIKKNENSQ